MNAMKYSIILYKGSKFPFKKKNEIMSQQMT